MVTRKAACGNYSILKSTVFGLFLVGIFGIPTATIASWRAPVEIISGEWGGDVSQFGIRFEDISDRVPQIIITSEEKILIRDGVNKRLKVYANTGNPETIIPYRVGRRYTELTLADLFGFSGDFVGYGEGGVNYFYRADQKLYISFSSSGQVLKTVPEKPLELGRLQSNSIGGGKFRTKVEYPDMTYQFVDEQPTVKYFRDLNKNFYRIETFTADSGDQETTAYRVHKYGKCSKKIAILDMPLSSYEPMPPAATTRPTWKPVPVMEYGEPLVAPNGDVYSWARTKTHYKILKWTWVEDLNAPSGPDAPSSLNVATSTNGLYLSWTASPQDPGCVTGYEISRATSGGGSGTTVGTTIPGTVTYNDSTAASGTMYYYKVRAVSGSEYSPYTSEVSGRKP